MHNGDVMLTKAAYRNILCLHILTDWTILLTQIFETAKSASSTLYS